MFESAPNFCPDSVVFENIHDAHNVTACLRTAEAVGVQVSYLN
jgi:tRNA G18 (ribose-2'-O)-methylase SpoU